MGINVCLHDILKPYNIKHMLCKTSESPKVMGQEGGT